MGPEAWRVEQALTRAVNDAIAAGCRRACERSAIFVCECGSHLCRDRCELSLDEYERLRADADVVVLAPRHAAVAAAH